MNTAEVAKLAEVHKDTLLRWLKSGLVAEPGRDRRGWRNWSSSDAAKVVHFAKGETASEEEGSTEDQQSIAALKSLDWDFADAKTSYLTHGLHPYPAKFIPQIPNALIQELSSVGETVFDPFCGSGTTLVEALTLKRRAIGIDANPVACLIARAKTTRLSQSDFDALEGLRLAVSGTLARFVSEQRSLFAPQELGEPQAPSSKAISFWFDKHVIEELAHLKSLCQGLRTEAGRTLALAVFSSIIVGVSRQDSDTRYVRREKHIPRGKTIRRFQRALETAIARSVEFTDLVEERFDCRVVECDILSPPQDLGQVDLVVCSPPYPNAYSYHLYHMTRMLWLDADPSSFKAIEIGSHRKYSSRSPNGATVETFKSEMGMVFRLLQGMLRPRRYCCLVIGDSIVRGTLIHNDELLAQVANESGFRLRANITRRLQDSKKSFNPKIGKIREEHILVFQSRKERDA